MLILGVDCATKTGLARWQIDRHESSIETSTIQARGPFLEQKVYDLAQKFEANLDRYGAPDMAVIEAPMKTTIRGNVGPTVALNQMAGAILGVLARRNIRFEMIDESTWRKSLYGFGRKQGWSSPQWKNHAKASCQQMGIEVKNADEAEAAMLAFYGGRISKIVKMARLEAA